MTSQQHIIADFPQLAIFSEIYAKIEIFAKKVLNVGISPDFMLIKKEMMFLTYTVRFKTIL